MFRVVEAFIPENSQALGGLQSGFRVFRVVYALYPKIVKLWVGYIQGSGCLELFTRVV